MIDVLFDEQRKQRLRASFSSLGPGDSQTESLVQAMVKQIEYEHETDINPDEDECFGLRFDGAVHSGQLEGPLMLLTEDSWGKCRYTIDPEDCERYASASITGDVKSGRLFPIFKVQVRVPCSSRTEFDETASLWYTLEGTVLKEDEYDPDITHRPSRELLSEPHLNLIRGWKKECLANHEACARNRTKARLPSRVIEIEPTCKEITEVSVIETIHLEDKHEYVCLSYCWGVAKQKSMTTTAVFPRQLTLTELPATIADAIRLCHALGYRYLWVDSLCIIQGDIKDWETESAQMCNIYGGASLTIATEVCDASVQSFIHRREDRVYFSGPGILTKVNGNPLSPKKRIWFYKKMDRRESSVWDLESDSLVTYGRKSTWLKRAWTYQEWMLSPKVLHIEEMTLWDCFEGYANEITQRSMRPAYLLRDLVANGEDKEWGDIIGHYSLRSLTKDIDRLPALGGIAQLYQEGTEHTYLAGLWLEEMPESLTWYRKGGDSKRSSGYTQGHIPSWSWASVETSFSMPVDNFSKTCASIKAWFCEYEPPGSLLQVKENAWIEIMGPLTQIVSCSNSDILHVKTRGTPGSYDGAVAHLDVDEPKFNEHVNAGIIFVLSIVMHSDGDEAWSGLVLREVHSDDRMRDFERVGYCDELNECVLETKQTFIRLI
ncbi:het domain-containing protein [Fusarium flagelliforme]|uniref:Het domain-containing protein n=1 Tax=Fusarium flagelliforme TaxID=2675880 RepID=A0A395N2N5_9HYPO|nr:het domain-containing protein [Fusarium flagelliforme]